MTAWQVDIDKAAEDLWRATLGQADIDAWCAAHGWSSNDVCSGSVTVYVDSDGTTLVTAELLIRDADGRPRVHGDELAVTTVAVPLSRSLPEGIAPVQTAST